MTTVEAIYENGILRLRGPTGLREGSRVIVTITEPADSDPDRRAAEFASRIAAMPLESAGRGPYSGADHDEILYSIPGSDG